MRSNKNISDIHIHTPPIVVRNRPATVDFLDSKTLAYNAITQRLLQ